MKVFVFSLFFYENPNLLGIYLFISEETELKSRNNLHKLTKLLSGNEYSVCFFESKLVHFIYSKILMNYLLKYFLKPHFSFLFEFQFKHVRTSHHVVLPCLFPSVYISVFLFLYSLSWFISTKLFLINNSTFSICYHLCSVCLILIVVHFISRNHSVSFSDLLSFRVSCYLSIIPIVLFI